ncbi:MAG: FxLYD domain-containing protein [Hydrogenoanaerobacterium sp.]
MKKIISMLFVAILCLGFVACSSGTGDANQKVEYVDKAFVLSLGKALEKRFDAADKIDAERDALSDAEYGLRLESLFDIELNALSDYRTGMFENPKLQEAAISYLNILQEGKAACADISADLFAFNTAYKSVYNKRIKLLSTFASDYGLSVDGSHTETLNSLLSAAKSVIKNEATEEAIESVINGVVFEEVENNYGWKTYRAVLDNTSGYDIEYISYSIDLVDANGVVLSQTYAGANNVMNGKKYNLEFSSDEAFASYTFTSEYSMAN